MCSQFLDGKEHVIAYASHSLSMEMKERKILRELLALLEQKQASEASAG